MISVFLVDKNYDALPLLPVGETIYMFRAPNVPAEYIIGERDFFTSYSEDRPIEEQKL